MGADKVLCYAYTIHSPLSILSFSVLVTATALMEGRFVEVDSVHVIKELLILPRGQRVVEHQLDYFCTSAGTTICQ